VRACVCVRVRACMGVCVCERERERERVPRCGSPVLGSLVLPAGLDVVNRLEENEEDSRGEDGAGGEA
jgi:hypothetical protein